MSKRTHDLRMKLAMKLMPKCCAAQFSHLMRKEQATQAITNLLFTQGDKTAAEDQAAAALKDLFEGL